VSTVRHVCPWGMFLGRMLADKKIIGLTKRLQ
jgi:hypothetical protein